ncbi:MAG: 3-deoxy-D-manno-octulosonic acid transferase [Granulosicoccus sp.]
MLYLKQRLGLYAASQPSESSSATIWIHAASVGEVFTVLPLLKAVSQPLLVTTTTPTGAAVLQQQSLTHVQHRYLPVDFSGACHRFFRSANIREAWIVETEIWPWLYAKAKSSDIPISIVNARLSEKTSAKADSLLATTFEKALSNVRVLARSKSDAEKFAELGASRQSITVVGNLKYANPTPDEKNDQRRRLMERPYLLAASTHDDEELQLSIEWSKQHRKGPETVLVIVPRHPERGATIQKQLTTRGIRAPLRSRNEPVHTNDSVYIADTLGELQAWYSYAMAAFIGGSLIERGGHNMLEAARLGCPMVTGQHTFNFEDIVQTLTEHEALVIADNAQQVMVFFNRVMDDRQSYLAMAARARSQAQISESVLDNYLELLLPS